MDTPAEQTTHTSYKDILSQVGSQLKARQGLIAKRVALVSLPLILTAVPLIYLGKLAQDIGIPEDQRNVIFYILLFLTLFVGLPWSIIMGQIFKMERFIWIDSFFDNVPLSNKESWQMAKKLFWPGVMLNILVFIRYYFPVILFGIGLLTAYTYLTVQKIIVDDWVVFVSCLIGYLIAFVIYAYFIGLHLRYLPFLLVDTYKTKNFAYGSLFKEMRKLNRTTKTGEYGKMLLTVLGTEAAANAAASVTGMLSGALTSGMNSVGKAAGQAASMYANEVVVVNKEYAQAVTFYVFYRVAHEVLYGNAQTVNHDLYSTVEPAQKV